ncbi:MAG: peptidoglycan DD-metalloendopeptidase family protein [Wenzhouxiangellaceae bacterium]|nr:peptidoglycan DD-metalloendopeptidase family protein [Wenzhouxiangellaceae bacterium]
MHAKRIVARLLLQPRIRPALVGGVSALVLVVFGLQMQSRAPDGPKADSTELAQQKSAPPESTARPADLEASDIDPAISESAQTDSVALAVESVQPAAEPRPDIQPERHWQYVQVASGDTLDIIFRRLGLSPRLLHEIVTLDEDTGRLADLRPGDEFAFDIDDRDGFRALRAESGDEYWLFVERDGETLTSRSEPRALEVRIAEVEAEITSSLFNAGKNAGLTDNMILRLAGIFGWDIDFALDIRRGDRFALVFEEIYRDDQFLRQGAILGARFINQGQSFAAVRFDAGNGPDYYDPEGRPMRKAFLRAPLNFTRVTSNFNPKRFHPVTRRVRPHNGTDYGAATGTPVWSAGDGTVIEAGYGAANGNYIFVKHGNHIVTRYLHLSKKQVKRGDRVRQGQTIGRVGATGMATGPHLHYEFLVNGRHRDPRKVDLPEVELLSPDLLPQYKAHASSWLARLERLLPPEVMLVSADSNGGTTAGGRPGSQQIAPE